MADEDDNTATNGTAEKPQLALGAMKGQAKLFTLLSCGFLVCLCCVTATFGGVGLGWARMSQLSGTVQAVGMPAGWSLDDSAALPWGAHAEVSGPADAAAVASWLRGLGEATDEKGAEKCLASGDCQVKFTMDDEEVSVVYSGDGERGSATVTAG